MSEIKSVQCANFTAALGETFRFSLYGPVGSTQRRTKPRKKK